jgi:phosphoadenosine phosphosulfate reductase
MLDRADLPNLNSLFAESKPEEIVRWAAAEFGDRLVMSSSFGADSAVLLHMATRVLPQIRVVMVDTGYLFPETFAFMEQLRLRMNLNVWLYRTRKDPVTWLKEAGEPDPTWRNEVDACCATNKNEPFDRALRELAPAAWMRGIRRSQASTRQERQFVEWSPRHNCFAISPLLSWGGREVHQYLKENGLPYHPLRDQGYVSIGCNPLSCTRPIKPGEDERSGRWSGSGKVECGINLTSLDSAGL